jgi:hypothetical protein
MNKWALRPEIRPSARLVSSLPPQDAIGGVAAIHSPIAQYAATCLQTLPHHGADSQSGFAALNGAGEDNPS